MLKQSNMEQDMIPRNPVLFNLPFPAPIYSGSSFLHKEGLNRRMQAKRDMGRSFARPFNKKNIKTTLTQRGSF